MSMIPSMVPFTAPTPQPPAADSILDMPRRASLGYAADHIAGHTTNHAPPIPPPSAAAAAAATRSRPLPQLPPQPKRPADLARFHDAIVRALPQVVRFTATADVLAMSLVSRAWAAALSVERHADIRFEPERRFRASFARFLELHGAEVLTLRLCLTPQMIWRNASTHSPDSALAETNTASLIDSVKYIAPLVPNVQSLLVVLRNASDAAAAGPDSVDSDYPLVPDAADIEPLMCQIVDMFPRIKALNYINSEIPIGGELFAARLARLRHLRILHCFGELVEAVPTAELRGLFARLAKLVVRSDCDSADFWCGPPVGRLRRDAHVLVPGLKLDAARIPPVAPHMHTIALPWCRALRDVDVQIVADACPQLRQFDFMFTAVTPDCLTSFSAARHPFLTRFDFDGCSGMAGPRLLPALLALFEQRWPSVTFIRATVRVDQSQRASVVDSMMNLHLHPSLGLGLNGSLPGDGDGVLRLIAANCPRLRQLYLDHSNAFSDEGFHQLFARLRGLRTLSANHNAGLTTRLIPSTLVPLGRDLASVTSVPRTAIASEIIDYLGIDGIASVSMDDLRPLAAAVRSIGTLAVSADCAAELRPLVSEMPRICIMSSAGRLIYRDSWWYTAV
ncbi:hypothetical protein GQ42DRAFT_2252 [Ramicandelaber brevisporus]|nr:hypothetical protein GQ42DRAFT_2252 [Ramicandelaber brevisporus]